MISKFNLVSCPSFSFSGNKSGVLPRSQSIIFSSDVKIHSFVSKINLYIFKKKNLDVCICAKGNLTDVSFVMLRWANRYSDSAGRRVQQSSCRTHGTSMFQFSTSKFWFSCSVKENSEIQSWLNCTRLHRSHYCNPETRDVLGHNCVVGSILGGLESLWGSIVNHSDTSFPEDWNSRHSPRQSHQFDVSQLVVDIAIVSWVTRKKTQKVHRPWWTSRVKWRVDAPMCVNCSWVNPSRHLSDTTFFPFVSAIVSRGSTIGACSWIAVLRSRLRRADTLDLWSGGRLPLLWLPRVMRGTQRARHPKKQKSYVETSNANSKLGPSASRHTCEALVIRCKAASSQVSPTIGEDTKFRIINDFK